MPPMRNRWGASNKITSNSIRLPSAIHLGRAIVQNARKVEQNGRLDVTRLASYAAYQGRRFMAAASQTSRFAPVQLNRHGHFVAAHREWLLITHSMQFAYGVGDCPTACRGSISETYEGIADAMAPSFCPRAAVPGRRVDAAQRPWDCRAPAIVRQSTFPHRSGGRAEGLTRGPLRPPQAAGLAVGFAAVFRDAFHRHHLLVVVGAEDAHALRVATGNADIVDGAANKLSAVGDEHDLSLSSIGKEAIIGPLRSLTIMAVMPLPPRPEIRYS